MGLLQLLYSKYMIQVAWNSKLFSRFISTQNPLHYFDPLCI